MPAAARRPSLLDRALGAVGFRRAQPAPAPRPRIGALYGAGAENRLVGSWYTPVLSANQEVAAAIRLSRARARALVQNGGYPEGIVTEIVNNVVGPNGIQLRAQNRTRDGALAKGTNFEIERAWKAWDVPEHASADASEAWTDLQRLIVRTLAIDGEVFVRRVKGADNPFGFALELIDADQVDESFNQRAEGAKPEVRMGVELGARNRPVAYHVWTDHPSEPRKRERVRIPATELRHLFLRKRPGQLRGLTWFAPVLLPFAMLEAYGEAEITAARAAAAKLGFFRPGADADVDERGPADLPADMTPGTWSELPQGYEIEQYNPQHPNAAFAEFVSAILRGIARGFGISYLTMTGDLRAANYSSMRAGLLPERDHWRVLQGWLSRTLHAWVFPAWLEMALLTPMLRVDSRLASNYADVVWQGRGWDWVDPLKDVQAAERRIKLGLDSRTALAAEQGRDFEDLVDELHDEAEYAAAEGVDVDGVDPRASVVPGATDAPAPADAADSSPPAATTRLRAVR
jgi:lambda family phage portal protein